jgi:hypothetical protein
MSAVHPRGFAPLWVYFFGLFALAVLQSWLLPPGEHSALFDVAVFGAGAIAVVVALTFVERRVKRR